MECKQGPNLLRLLGNSPRLFTTISLEIVQKLQKSVWAEGVWSTWCFMQNFRQFNHVVAQNVSESVFFPHLSGEGLLDVVSAVPPPPPPPAPPPPPPPDLNCKRYIAVFPAGPEQQTQDQSVPRRTSTTKNLRRYSGR